MLSRHPQITLLAALVALGCSGEAFSTSTVQNELDAAPSELDAAPHDSAGALPDIDAKEDVDAEGSFPPSASDAAFDAAELPDAPSGDFDASDAAACDCKNVECVPPAVKACVCAIDEWCCTDWDSACAGKAAVFSCGSCE